MRVFLKALSKAQKVKSVLKVSLVVGSILNLINRNGLMPDDCTISWLHVLMNYIVPYCLPSHSVAMNEISAK